MEVLTKLALDISPVSYYITLVRHRKEMLPKLDYWKRYDELSDNGQFEEFKMRLINEINDLHIDGLPKVDKLNALVGKYVNLVCTYEKNGENPELLIYKKR